MARFRVTRMQTNALWVSPPVKFTSGSPPVVVDPTAWVVSGHAQGATRLDLTLDNGRLSFVSARLIITLSAADCAALDVGRVDFEIMRISPQPAPRPILRFCIENYGGV